ncbi:MAG: dihydrofolate reductase [Planctomycetota bacterium]
MSDSARPPVAIIVAAAENGVIGAAGDLPWRQSADLKRFKELTTDHVIVMGRKTFESVGKPLPRRTNIVITRSPDWSADGVLTAASLDEALDLAVRDDRGGRDREVFICGGAAIYDLAFDRADRFYLTVIHADVTGDTRLPAWKTDEWTVTADERFPADDRNDHDYSFRVLERA